MIEGRVNSAKSLYEIMNSLVSIIVRTKDRPKLLKDALCSIAAQTYRPIEVVLVNDGGCDLDIEEIKSILGDVSLNYIKLEKNTGRAHAGNVGIENSKGEYIGILDDDDEYYSEHIGSLCYVLETTEHKVAYSDVEMRANLLTSDGREIITVKDVTFSKDFSYSELLMENYIPFNGLLFQKSVFEVTGLLDEKFDLYEDWDLLIRIAKKFPFYHLKKVTAVYNQWSREMQINQKDPAYMKASHLKVMDKHNDKLSSEFIRYLWQECGSKDVAILQKDTIIKEKDALIVEKDANIVQLQDTLNKIHKTLGWQLLERLRRMREKIFPVHTRRRKGFDLLIKPLKTDPLSENHKEILHHNISKKLFVLFLVSPWAGVTNRYRAYNMKECLELGGIDSEIMEIADIETRFSHALSFDIVVIHRIPMNDVLSYFIKKCRDCHIPVVFDLDDYIFDSSLIERMDEISRMEPDDRNKWIRNIHRCRKTLDAADYFVGTTDFLVNKVRDLGKTAFVIRNAFNKTQVIESERALKEIQRDPRYIKIGLFSGTRTHQKDFETVRPALLRILNEYENTILCIGGYLDLDQSFAMFSRRIERLPYVHWKELSFNIAKVDINIVPLEPDNPFCEAKSELKYFEAALLKIPTIATPSDAFRWAINDGENGLLASTEEEWYLCLKSLIESPSLRKRLGENAFKMVMETYTPDVQSKKIREVYEHILRDYRVKTEMLSIIIRCRNEEAFIGKVLSKIFEQSFDKPFEVIVVDSGSTDRTLEIVKNFEVKVLEIPPEVFTFGNALNQGISMAKGGIICCLSAHSIPADNFFLKGLVEPIMSGRAHATIGRQIPIKGMNPYEEFALRKIFPDIQINDKSPHFSNANGAFLRNLWEENKFDEKIIGWEDYLWYLQMNNRYIFLYCPRATVYHSHPFSLKHIMKRAYSDGKAIKSIRALTDIDITQGKADSPGSMIKKAWEDFKGTASYCRDEGYYKHLFLLPMVKPLLYTAFLKGLRSQ